MDSLEHSRQILSYWTPDRIVSATPEDPVDDQDVIDGDSNPGDSGPRRTIPDNEVTKFPYQSVGKLMYTKGKGENKGHHHGTAWVAKFPGHHNIIVTAAHCLENRKGTAENIIFIPAFIPPNTEPFGKYTDIGGGKGKAWAVHPEWVSQVHKSEYDIALIKVMNPDTKEDVAQKVKPIPIISNQKYSKRSEWNQIGYGDGKMMERRGKYYKKEKDLKVYKYGDLPDGCSGGPWILTGSDGANGVYSASNDNNGVSPYFKYSEEDLLSWFTSSD